ncbi:hypothetical protein [Paraflavitalea speifideaquila]|uniref:hypothetical protein n=1 Tax=Paraflavitalea speifideaquila TaxID=3076558 RepID=UPI0028EAFB6C|nr:hypothetical protein [Paraflavitalea speifideiaquila]
MPANLPNEQLSATFNYNRELTKKLQANFVLLLSTARDNLTVTDLVQLFRLPPTCHSLETRLRVAIYGKKRGCLHQSLAHLQNRYYADMASLLAGLLLEYKVTPKTTLKLNMGINNARVEERQAYPTIAQMPSAALTGAAFFAYARYKSFIVEPQLHYSIVRKEKEKDISLLLGGTFLSQQDEAHTIAGSGYTDDALLFTPRGPTPRMWKQALRATGMRLFSAASISGCGINTS